MAVSNGTVDFLPRPGLCSTLCDTRQIPVEIVAASY